MNWHTSDDGYGGWWAATDLRLKGQIAARAASALEFFRKYTGMDSEWSRHAQLLYDNEGHRQSMESGARAVADLLREWSTQVESGIIDIPGARAAAEFKVASTDLMTQVRTLLEDRDVHPAAPVVLAGAALEVALRAALEEHSLALSERPSISAYARRLRQEQLLAAQDVKDVEQIAGIRNLAAHGEFATVTHERAGLMEQQVNLFLARLRALSEQSPPSQTDHSPV